jgi:hypothetical protein
VTIGPEGASGNPVFMSRVAANDATSFDVPRCQVMGLGSHHHDLWIVWVYTTCRQRFICLKPSHDLP